MDVETVFRGKLKDKFNFSFDLKDKQISLINNILLGRNCVGIFPTGYGKSLCFQLLPLFCDEIYGGKHTGLVISPLKSLMIDQCQQTQKMGISSICVTKKDEMEFHEIEGIKRGNYSLLYMSPEVLLQFHSWQKIILENSLYQNQLCIIAVDEVHIIETWGDKFRPTFVRLGELRSHFTDVPFLLLTATCTPGILQFIKDKLHMDNPLVESVSPDRPNVFLNYKSEPGMDPLTELQWLITEIKQKGKDAQKSILYVRSVAVLGKIYCAIMAELRFDAFLDKTELFQNRLISTYHAGLSNHDQHLLVEKFTQKDSVIRLVICTVAFGLGVNIPNVRNVIHWGASDSVLQYWQEVGRAGRDGNKSVAFYYVTRTSLLSVQDNMRNICIGINSGKIICLRKAILECMVGYCKKKHDMCSMKCSDCCCAFCSCCSICKTKCLCNI